MPSHELLITFFVTAAVFAYIPGPAMLYAAARTLTGGRSSGLMASLGIHLGCYVHVVAAAAGLSILFHSVPPLYVAVKLCGAAYLVWLGISLFRSHADGEIDIAAIRPKTARRAFLESVTVEVLNPKTAIFFVAFLPQFVDAGAVFPVWVQLLILGTVVNFMFSSADIVCVFLASGIVNRMKSSSRIQRWMQRTGGAILVGLGLRLAFEES